MPYDGTKATINSIKSNVLYFDFIRLFSPIISYDSGSEKMPLFNTEPIGDILKQGKEFVDIGAYEVTPTDTGTEAVVSLLKELLKKNDKSVVIPHNNPNSFDIGYSKRHEHLYIAAKSYDDFQADKRRVPYLDYDPLANYLMELLNLAGISDFFELSDEKYIDVSLLLLDAWAALTHHYISSLTRAMMQTDNNVFSNSVSIDDTMLKYSKVINKSLDLFLPDLSSLAFEDILEIKIKCNDELESLRHYIGSLSTELNPFDFGDVGNLVSRQVKNAIEEFKMKLSDLPFDCAKILITDVSTLSVLPITTFIHNLPLPATIGFSGTVAAVKSIAEIKKKTSDIKKHPLYFMRKLQKQSEKIQKKARKRLR